MEGKITTEEVDKLLTVIVCGFFVLNVCLGMCLESVQSVAPFLSVIFMLSFSFIHGIHRYGTKRMLAFLVISVVTSWCYETCSIHTGFPFGFYNYSDKLGLKIGVVPILIMPAYFSVCYLSWTVAHILLEKLTTNYQDYSVITVPVIAAFVMVSWDLSMDPARSTYSQQWVWTYGGPYFGVPIENFLGWYLCVYTIFQLFAFYSRSNDATFINQDQQKISQRYYWQLAVMMYATIAVEFVLQPYFGVNITLVDNAGKEWNSRDMYKTLALVCLFTMGFISILTTFKLYNYPYSS